MPAEVASQSIKAVGRGEVDSVTKIETDHIRRVNKLFYLVGVLSVVLTIMASSRLNGDEEGIPVIVIAGFLAMPLGLFAYLAIDLVDFDLRRIGVAFSLMGAIFLFVACVFFALDFIEDVAAFVDVPSIIFVCFPIFVIAPVLRAKGLPVAKTLKELGLPLGIVGTLIGACQIVTTRNELDDLNPAIAVMLVTVFYGGLVSVLGRYFDKDEQSEIIALSNYDLAVCIGIVVLIGWASISSHETFLNPVALLIFGAFLGLGLVVYNFRKKKLAQLLLDAGTGATLLCLVIALIVWFAKGYPDGSVLELGTIAIFYGTLIFIITFFISLRTGEYYAVNFDIKIWHIAEAASFFIFLIFAPMNLFQYNESLKDSEPNEVI